MAESMTYASLLTDVQAYLERGYATDPTVFAQIPRLIMLAEKKIARRLKVQGLLEVVTATLEEGVSVYQKPDRWRRTVSMEFGQGEDLNERKQLFARGYEYCRTYWPDSAQEDAPEFYADYNYNNWLVVPTPDADYPWQIIYSQIPPLLDAATQTNWLTEYAPDVLLYSTLLEAAPFLKNDERIPVWQAMNEQSIQALNMQDLDKIVDRNTVRRED